MLNRVVLITLRNIIAATNLIRTHGSIIQVEPIDKEDALALLNTKVSVSESGKADAKALIQALEGIPLAISYAAAYIKIRVYRITILHYLEFLCGSEEIQMHLLGQERLQDLRQDYSIRYTVFIM